MEEVKNEVKAEKEAEISPDQKMQDSLKSYSFLRYTNGTIAVDHEECKDIFKLKILKMGDLNRRGTILANLNGGSTNVDEETATLNSCMATVQVGYENFKFNLLEVTDSQLVLGLYTAVVCYNNFFRKAPLGIIL